MRDAVASGRTPAGAPVASLIAALGGASNVESVEPRGSRLCVAIRSEDALDRDRLRALAPRGFAVASPTSLHLIVGDDAPLWAEQTQERLAKDANCTLV